MRRLRILVDWVKSSFTADKVLFPSKVVRIILYGMMVIAISVIYIATTFAVLLLGFFIAILPIAWWVSKATQYILVKDKEGREQL